MAARCRRRHRARSCGTHRRRHWRCWRPRPVQTLPRAAALSLRSGWRCVHNFQLSHRLRRVRVSPRRRTIHVDVQNSMLLQNAIVSTIFRLGNLEMFRKYPIGSRRALAFVRSSYRADGSCKQPAHPNVRQCGVNTIGHRLVACSLQQSIEGEIYRRNASEMWKRLDFVVPLTKLSKLNDPLTSSSSSSGLTLLVVIRITIFA